MELLNLSRFFLGRIEKANWIDYRADEANFRSGNRMNFCEKISIPVKNHQIPVPLNRIVVLSHGTN